MAVDAGGVAGAPAPAGSPRAGVAFARANVATAPQESLPPLWVRLENALKPLLIPATGGVLTAVICFCLIMGSQVVPITNIPDVTVQLVTPARVQALAPMDFNTGDNGLVLVTAD